MFLKILLISATFNLSAGYIPADRKSKNGLIYDFVERNANYSSDPCQDFASHICPYPERANFHDQIKKEYNRIWKIQEENGHRLKNIWIEHETSLSQIDMFSWQLRTEPKFIYSICESNQVGRILSFNIASLFNTFKFLTSNPSCLEITKFLVKNADVYKLEQAYSVIYNGAIGIVVHEYIETKSRRIHQLFSDIKKEFIELLKITPWVRNKKVINKYIARVEEMTIHDLGDFAKPLEKAILEFENSYSNCRRIGFEEIVCRFGTIPIAVEIMKTNEIFNTMWISEMNLESIWNIFNTNDETIFIGNHAALLAYTDRPSAFYGLLGYLIGHEFMHTFVFDKDDTSDLRNFWTRESKCVAEQTMETCRNFDLRCGDSIQTFEEDAADFNGIRIAWEVYQQHKNKINEEYRRFMGNEKKPYNNAYELTDDQLFFYASGLFFCDENLASDTWDDKFHNQHRIRINNVASQMDQFHEAFQCRRDDKIVRNKVSTCVQYGSQASQYKAARPESE